MPELPEVEVTRKGVEQHCQGLSVQALQVYQRALRWPVPNAVQHCVGLSLNRVERRAKYILMYFDPHVLVVHLGMSGSLQVAPLNSPLQKHYHL